MSYTREDCALETCLIIATVDIDQLDPDELYTFAKQVIKDARHVRDWYDD